jgi:hypothetical protein
MASRGRAVVEDPNLLSSVGLVPLLALSDRAGLPELLAADRGTARLRHGRRAETMLRTT